MNHRQIGFLGIATWILFWGASLVLGALRPSYSHVVNTISELGAVGTPHATMWNVLGFIIPGFLLAIVGAAIARAATKPSTSRVLATLLLVLSGVAIAGQGVLPAVMIDGVADVTSASTQGHFISSLISAGAWTVGALLLVRPMKSNPNWRRLAFVGLALVVLAVGASLALRGTLPDGLAQRVGNTFFCAWFVLMSLKLISLEPQSETGNSAEVRGAV